MALQHPNPRVYALVPVDPERIPQLSEGNQYREGLTDMSVVHLTLILMTRIHD